MTNTPKLSYTPPMKSVMRKKPAPDQQDKNGIDLTLIRWTLSLTPQKRLELAQKAARDLMKLRGRISKP